MKRTLQNLWAGTALPFVLGLLHLAAPLEAHAARLLHVQIERDGVVLLESDFGSSDEAGRERICGRLKDVELEEASASPLAQGQQELALQGDLRITIRHVDRELVRVEVDRLKLRRAAAGARKWQLPREEVERAAIRGGLDVTQLYPPERSSRGPLMTVAAIAGGGLIALAIWLVTNWLLRRGGGQPTAT